MRKLIKKCSKKIYQFSCTTSSLNSNIKVQLPNLDDLSFNCFGDWGPCISFNLNKQEYISIQYDELTFVPLKQKNLVFDTPINPETRELYPLFLIISDRDKNVNFRLYLKKDFMLGKVEFDFFNNNEKRSFHHVKKIESFEIA